MAKKEPRPDCPEGRRWCPDCGRCRELDAFYRIKAAKYAGGYRYSAYCKEHHNARNLAAKATRPEQAREIHRRSNRAYYQKVKHDPQYRARNAKNVKAYRQRHPDRTAQAYRSWVERHPEERRASQRAWAERQRRRWRPIRRADPALDATRQELAQRDQEAQQDE